MNDLLQLKGNFIQKSNTSRPAAPSLPSNTVVEVKHLWKLYHNLERIREFWNQNTLIEGALVSVYYTRVIPKSRRIEGFLSSGGTKANETIKGARFINDGNKRKHIITHYVPYKILDESIKRVKETINIVIEYFGEQVTNKDIEVKSIKAKNIKFDNIAKINFLNIIVDAYFVEKFDVLEYEDSYKEKAIISIFETKVDTKQLLEKLGIEVLANRIIDKTTLLLRPDELDLLRTKAPYLISMAVKDLSTMTKDDFLDFDIEDTVSIPSPSNEPVIGVIDTLFDERVYFSEWVEFENRLDKDIPLSPRDYEHGTMVSSIIVDGPTINPDLDDGCGRFRVRHFGIASSSRFSSFSIVRAIKEIIAANRDIKVWNLSLGSNEEIEKNFISPEAAILDQIQYENDVIFVISGTNKPRDRQDDMAIGSPADSINSLIVNAVDINNKPASYARRGIVLSFFNKPDVCCFGGSAEKPMKVCDPNGERFVVGTSFAAPWISRKMAYLIHVIGLSREVAKALIIDSATRWECNDSIYTASLLGHGIVPKNIKDVINSKDDEIKFVLSGTSDLYDTYNYNIPVPVYKEEHPFVAKATLCYFPKCSRNQGVDYTNTELDIYFGRIKEDKIKSINKNNQSIEGVQGYINEEDARSYYRKWDNSKHITEVFKAGIRSRKTYSNKMWGLSIKKKNRFNPKEVESIRFGIVITLKEINGINRIDAFIQQCSLRGWLVNRIDVQNSIDIFVKANEEIEFD
jgi:hypothetical protein